MEIVSCSGMAEALRDNRVRMIVCPTVGTVSSRPSAAAAAAKAGTPGTMT